jgi:CRP-like cAMP-binding protein
MNRQGEALKPQDDRELRADVPRRPTTTTLRVATPLTRKLSRLVTLAPDEVGMLDDLQSATRVVRRNREIGSEGRKYDALLILIDGVSIRSRILHDGRRQILNVALPGDFIASPATSSNERSIRSPR